MGIDQAYEKNNKILKTDGGVIRILDNPTALLKWAICGPVISEILKEEEDGSLPELHHEDTAGFEKDFCNTRIWKPFRKGRTKSCPYNFKACT